MILFVVLAVLITATEGCELPAELSGQWDSSLAGWSGLSITNTTISTLKAEGRDFNFSCYLHNGTNYVLQSPELTVGDIFKYNYYFCVDIVPSTTTSDVVFFRIRTAENPKHADERIQTIPSTVPKTMAGICSTNATELPLDYTLLLRRGYANSLGNETCPANLQGVFSANFTTSSEQAKCPEGFELNGCNHSHITFNYTQCGNGSSMSSSGSPVYMCLTSVKNGDVTYTSVVLQGSQQQNNPYQYACLAQEKGQDGKMNITKSAGTCGGSPSVDMEAMEMMSCRATPSPATTTETLPGSGNTTQASANTTQGSGGGGQGGGNNGDGNSCSYASWGMLSFLLPALVSLLTAVNM
ncbi:hypothetical protein ACOMHN_050954 [Nucella lapillus]